MWISCTDTDLLLHILCMNFEFIFLVSTNTYFYSILVLLVSEIFFFVASLSRLPLRHIFFFFSVRFILISFLASLCFKFGLFSSLRQHSFLLTIVQILFFSFRQTLSFRVKKKNVLRHKVFLSFGKK